jgi:hypothetical protein
MRRFVAVCSVSVLALAMAACTAATESANEPAVASAQAGFGIDCPCCFTIVECMRNGVGVECDEVQTMRCERCCEQLTFTKGEGGQLFVATKRAPSPMPVQVCMPMPPR